MMNQKLRLVILSTVCLALFATTTTHAAQEIPNDPSIVDEGVILGTGLIVNRYSNYCLEATRSDDNAAIRQSDCNDENPNQLWVLVNPPTDWYGYQIRNIGTGKCLEIEGNNDEKKLNGALAVMFTCYDDARWQRWTVPLNGNGHNEIKNTYSLGCLEPSGSPELKRQRGTLMQQWTCDSENYSWQTWAIPPFG